MSVAPDTQLRHATRAQLIAAGTPWHQVDAILDLAFDAAEQAIQQLLDVVETTHDERVRLTAFNVALGVTRSRLDEAEAAFREGAAAVGVPTRIVVVEGVHHG